MREVTFIGKGREDPAVAWGSVVAPGGPESDRPWRGKLRELDTQRGLAVVAVVLYHLYQFCNINNDLYLNTPAYTVLNSLDAAVPWLFVIIGYSAFEPIARRAIENRFHFSPRRFLSDRAARILPVYYVAVITVWLMRQPRLPGDWRDLVEHLTFTQVFDEKRIFYTIGPAWALSAAVWFYLILAALGIGITWGAARLAGRRQRLILLSMVPAGLAAVSLAWKAWSFSADHRSSAGPFTTWFGPMSTLDNFAVGMAVALIVVAGRGRPSPGIYERIGLRVAGIAILVAASLARQPDSWSAVYFSAICSVGFGCLVAAAARGPHPADRPAGRPVVVRAGLNWLGTIAFSVYLWHEPVILAMRSTGAIRQVPDALWLNTLIVLPVAVAVGWLSWIAIERPVRQMAAEFTQIDPTR